MRFSLLSCGLKHTPFLRWNDDNLQLYCGLSRLQTETDEPWLCVRSKREMCLQRHFRFFKVREKRALWRDQPANVRRSSSHMGCSPNYWHYLLEAISEFGNFGQMGRIFWEARTPDKTTRRWGYACKLRHPFLIPTRLHDNHQSFHNNRIIQLTIP